MSLQAIQLGGRSPRHGGRDLLCSACSFCAVNTRIFPLFTLYIAFNLLTTWRRRLGAGLLRHMPRVCFPRIAAASIFDRIGCSFRDRMERSAPGPSSLPPGVFECLSVLSALALLCGTLLAWHFENTGNNVEDIRGPLDLTVGLLRMLIFVVPPGSLSCSGSVGKTRSCNWPRPCPFTAWWI